MFGQPARTHLTAEVPDQGSGDEPAFSAWPGSRSGAELDSLYGGCSVRDSGATFGLELLGFSVAESAIRPELSQNKLSA